MAYFHVWFATKSRKWLLQGDVREAAKREFSTIALNKRIKLLECEAVVDHVHLLLEVSDRGRLPRIMNDLKGISARHLFEEFPELKLDAETNHFWQQRYGSKLVAPGALDAIKRYIRSQWDRLESFER